MYDVPVKFTPKFEKVDSVSFSVKGHTMIDPERVEGLTFDRVLWTGLRDQVGPRASSVPAKLDQDGEPAEVLGHWFRTQLARPPPRAVIQDILRWFETGRLGDRAGWVDYGLGLPAVGGPALLVAGMSDPVAPPEEVLQGLGLLSSSAEARFHLLSRVQGDREEYGHLGMLLSRHSARDLDPLILAWMEGRKRLP